MKGMGNENIEDLDIVERVLRGCEVALEVVRKAHQEEVEKFLRRSGASAGEALEIALQVITDSAMGTRARAPLFRKYSGQSPLAAWLKTVALHVLIDRRRREKRMVSLDAGGGDEAAGKSAPSAQSAEGGNREETLIELMKNALLRAISRRRGSEMVMLYLRHIHGVTQRELSETWGWHESKVSRVLDSAMKAIAAETLAQIRRADPMIDLKWNDFLELAGSAEFSLFERPGP